MTDIKTLMRRDLWDFKAYHAPLQQCRYKMDANESPFPMPEKLRAKLIEWVSMDENFRLYPDTDNTDLRKAIARFWNRDPNEVTCGVGSDQMIEYICKVFLEPGDSIVTHNPSFSMYGLTARLNHGRAVNVPLKEDLSPDVDGLAEAAAKSNAKIVFACNPNNPTGGGFSNSQLQYLVENMNGILVVDEAYADFGGETFIPFIGRYANLIVIRTFSKAYGMAGVRLGYALAAKQTVDAINLAKTPFNVPTVSQLLGTWLLNDKGTIKKQALYLADQRDWMFCQLKKISWLKVYPSKANFLYVTSPRDIGRFLEKQGILVRRFPSVDNIFPVRISVGMEKENREVIQLLQKMGESL